MDCIKYLSSYDEIAALVNDVAYRRIYNPAMQEHFRGQGRPEYELVPTVARGLTDGETIRDKETRLIKAFQDEIICQQIPEVLRIDERLTDKQNIWNILFQAQHFGIHTRLLDWSLKWQVGLWFAVENFKNDEVDGQFWILSVPNEIHCNHDRNSYFQKDIANLDHTYFINAPIYMSCELPKQVAEVKRQRQQGKFTISPYQSSFEPLDQQADIAPFLEKYCIPANIKGQLRLELTARGIHKEFLYYREHNQKILDGVIKSIK